MEKFLKKFVPLAFLAIIFINLLVYFTNTYFNWRQARYTEMQIAEKRRKNDWIEQDKEATKAELDKKQLEAVNKQLEGFSGKGLYKVHESENKPGDPGYLGIRGIDEAKRTQNLDTGRYEEGLQEEGYLLFSDETKEHFCQIIQDIDDWINNNGQLGSERGQVDKDNYSNYLVRNNCILYGAPGTGKTEFVRELNRILVERYGKEPEKPQEHNDPNDPNYGLSVDPEEQEAVEKGIKKPQIPVVEVKGASLQSAGPTVNDALPQEKLAKILQRFKEEHFKDDGGIASKRPYIIFLEEADQARNVMVDKPKRNLEDFKNFLSSSSDKDGLNVSHISQAAQDRNSVIIIATNNYEDIDPAMKRRGRLGKSLNFTWTPETLKEYSQGDSEGNYKVDWPQISGEDHYCWKFKENEDYYFIFELAKKMNFSNYKNKFSQKTNDILTVWKGWNEEERDDFARSRLGLEAKVWCDTCQIETNPEKASQKRQRLKGALQNVDDAEQKAQIYHQQMEKKLTDCGHEAKPVANWLLHYIYTFFVYYESQNLENFTHPNQIQRYKFNEKRLLRERVNQLRMDLNDLGQDMMNTFGEELRRISNNLEKLENSNKENITELTNIRDAIETLANNVNNLPI
jgi:hypothetical protein